jgi:hypothetical protein
LGTGEEGGEEQGIGSAGGRQQPIGLAKGADRLYVFVELAFLGQQSFHQAATVAVVFQAPQQQMAEGTDGGQGIAQLMHQQPQLFLLGFHASLQALLLQIKAQGFRQADGHPLKPLLQKRRPGGSSGFHLQRS